VNAQQLWQAQETDAPRVTLEYVLLSARAFERRIFWRNAFEYAGGVASFGLFVFFAWEALPHRPWFAAGLAWFALFMVYVGIQWHLKAGLRVAPEDGGVLDTLRFQRRHLERQRDARRGNWRWWVPPFVPGAALLIAGHVIETREPFGLGTLVMVVWLAGCVASGVEFYERGARRLQREIDALDSLAEERRQTP
jgi:hypothetical protein